MTASSQKSRVRFACIYHSTETRNWRKLEEYIERDTEGNIISNRKKEDTAINTKDYTWEIYWSVKSIGKQGSGILVGQLNITRGIYSYILAPNFFIYKVYQKATIQY